MSEFENMLEDKSLAKIKEKAIKTANQLKYSKNVIDKINEAETEGAVYRILIDARRGIIE